MEINLGQDNHSFGHEGENMELFNTAVDCTDRRPSCQAVPISSICRICRRENFRMPTVHTHRTLCVAMTWISVQ